MKHNLDPDRVRLAQARARVRELRTEIADTLQKIERVEFANNGFSQQVLPRMHAAIAAAAPAVEAVAFAEKHRVHLRVRNRFHGCACEASTHDNPETVGSGESVLDCITNLKAKHGP